MSRKLIATLLACILAMAGLTACSGGQGSPNSSTARATSTNAEYASTLFDTSKVHEINIEIAENDWADLCANPLEKTKYHANVTIDGTTVKDVSFATKGNTSLTSVASDANSDRYSFKINFGKYVDDQTYQGLDKLSLNNTYADATYMKDYMAYRIMAEANAYAPLCSYIWVKVNGEDFGLYIAIEEVGDSWLNRMTGGKGSLYKPETEQFANMNEMPAQGAGAGAQAPAMPDGAQQGNADGNGQQQPPIMPNGNGGNDSQQQNGPQPPTMQNNNGGNGAQAPAMPDGAQQGGNPPEGMPDGAQPGQAPDDMQQGQMPDGMQQGQPGQGGPGNSDKGASLKYTDDEISSYSDIFDNAETKVSETDEARVIAALKALSEGDAAAALYTDDVINYFAAHNFVMNYDSYTGTMLHNYYLYEDDGKLAMAAWDYNLGFGGFMGLGGGQPDGASNATYIVNYGIDTPLYGTTESERPMWAWIASSDQYLSSYHKAMNNLISGYFESGDFDKEIAATYELIRPYVSKDPSAFYSVEQFQTGYETLKQFCDLRAKSIRLQLDGKLDASTDSQEPSSKVDASSVNIASMGTQDRTMQ